VDKENPEETISTVSKLSKMLDVIVFKAIRLQDSTHIPSIPTGLSDKEVSVLSVRRYFDSQPNLVQRVVLTAYHRSRHALVAVLKRILRIVRGGSK